MRDIDGSYGEGGGQLLRTSVALAAITGQPVHVYNIRAKRSNPGLAPQHLTAVKAVAALCGAEAEGLEVKSREISFRPGPLRGGQYDFPIGTAGSITLVLQAALPVAMVCGEPLRMNIVGGTDVRAAPPLDYFRYVLLPLLSGMGVRAKIDLLWRGYYPRGGGYVTVEVEPSPSLRPLILDAPGSLTQIRGFAHISNMPAHIVQRMAGSALAELSAFPTPAIDLAILGVDKAIGMGGAILLNAYMEHTRLAASAVAERGVPAERLGSVAGQLLREEILSGATLDIHAADQVLIYLALAGGASCFLARSLSSHAATTIWLLEQFLPIRFSVSREGSLVRIKAEPNGFD
ncbi:RNA 3'-terminal phosphate cyclase [Nitrosovibrio sp. Nv4]|uniref:RNA 3'-terminal phosphate cyclase n=1 Tax=Nitrosovibrio sp. Nv4 TaxID=1945880 RepID=UPI000BCF0BC8|nr:RNA 3'-terminal phosphate cyclase [Nitrosovibrio sp. Nv4]SOD42559.1 RNA 3'-terminal phosphate cyclase (ATP)/RNA 3'-terminal phosphate cyclase (GTP) [Nitrosovibrio sp. Nv4]